ncbi:HNH endonuclease [Kibdelosporangium aridum]|uniref:HNH endonuclease n=1 Tax=Kibdelosporangium aridum TaxID=2030 RepID=A0A428Z9K4_KIBAR|nr:HNH endonuclease signature motif containing protein [Kibdelosporangium aridum]RSM84747.1 HNH endonuclease [Kibdelosporangium aridum]
MSDTKLARVKQAFQQKARADAEYIRALADYATDHQPTRKGASIADGAPEEIAVELNMSPNKATVDILLAQHMVTRLPNTVDALEHGTIDLPRAKAMRDYTEPLDEDQAAEVEKRVLDNGPRDNLTKFKRGLGKEVIRADPEGAEERRQLAKAERDVAKWHKPFGPSALTIYLEPHEAELAYNQIDSLARRIKTPDRSLAQCRADVFMDLVIGKNTLQPLVNLNVVVPMTTLMGLNREPGEISGIGPITAEYARELAQDATWRRILTDPAGEILEVSNRRFPSPALRRHTQLRDRECRQPGCTIPAQRCELDHSIPHYKGGLTKQNNLILLCKKHNLMRQRSTWNYEQVEPGVLVFHTPSKQTVVTKPEPYDPPPF